MKKSGSARHHHAERAIIDALLKISHIIQKTEIDRQSTTSKKPAGDGDCSTPQQVPAPPPMRTLDSYVSEFNQQASNCNQASNICTQMASKNSTRNGKNCTDWSLAKQCTGSCKRYCSDASYSSDDLNPVERSSKRRFSYSSLQSDRTSQPVCEELKTVDNQPTITSVNSPTVSRQAKSAATTVRENPSCTSLPTMSAAAAPFEAEKHEQCQRSVNELRVRSVPFEQQLQIILEQRLRDHFLPSAMIENGALAEDQKLSSVTLTRSETGKLMNSLRPQQPQCDSTEQYEKQRQLALQAAQASDYALSYDIYTDLLRDGHHDHKRRSEILASRATTLLLDQRCFDSIDDCTRAIAFNQWNKLAYVVRAACWMIEREYSKALEDYSKLFHLFDQSQYVLDLLNLAYEKLKAASNAEENKPSAQSIDATRSEKSVSKVGEANARAIQSLSLASPAVYFCYPCQASPTSRVTNGKEPLLTEHATRPAIDAVDVPSSPAHPSPIISEQSLHLAYVTKRMSSNNNACTHEHPRSPLRWIHD